VSDAGHFGGNRGQGLATEILVVAILGDMTPEVIAETVLALMDGHLGRQPEGPAQAGIAVLRQPGQPAELSGLMSGKIEAAELQKLTVMTKPAQVSGLRQYRQRMDWPDPGQLAQARVVGVGSQKLIGLGFDRIALTDQATRFCQDQPEHDDRGRIERHWQSR
jgi:hypothetical protein